MSPSLKLPGESNRASSISFFVLVMDSAMSELRSSWQHSLIGVLAACLNMTIDIIAYTLHYV